MICLSSIIGFNGEQADLDELFAHLQQAVSVAERQEIVCRALRSGVDQNELREMLDYLEAFGNHSRSAREISGPKRKEISRNHRGSWAAFLCGLIYR